MITKYEDVDNNESIAHYFGDLSINVYNDYIPELTSVSLYTKFEQFYISIDQMQSSKSIIAVNALVDNTFKYQIILNDKTVSSITPVLFVFNLFTNLQYNDNKFKGLIINLFAST